MDKIPLNSFQILAIFFPGVLLAFASSYCYYFTSIETHDIVGFFRYFKDYGIGLYFSFLCFGIFLGLVLDAIRNGVLESLFNKLSKKNKKINWDYFYKGDPEKIVLLYSRYYNYYVFDINMSVALIFAFLTQLFLFHSNLIICVLAIELVIISVLIMDARALRHDIVEITKANRDEQV